MLSRLFRNFFLSGLILIIILLGPVGLFNIQLENFTQPSEDFPQVALVLGAGILGPDTPSLVLQKRLDVALDLYKNQKISKILVSGDNRTEDYNEPRTMINYLKNNGVDETDIVADYAGTRTIESCWRARNVFNLNKVYVITQRFHLPRALYLCRTFGINTIPLKANDSFWEVAIRGFIREIPASWSAFMEAGSYSGQTYSDGTEIDLSEL